MPVVPERLTTTVSTKGQVILPKAIRELRHWPAGTRLTVENTADGVLLKLAPVFAVTSVEAMFGSLALQGKAKSIEEMDTAIVAEAKHRARD
jgi:AbrB family looped-hinge helix DNA binding protein